LNPRETLSAFDQFLAARALRLDIVVIGGAALNLLGVVSRLTKDCDIVYPQLPADDWRNNGPATLAVQLPFRWQRRLQTMFTGQAIVLRSLGREDLVDLSPTFTRWCSTASTAFPWAALRCFT
jgi:hypothetical protein